MSSDSENLIQVKNSLLIMGKLVRKIRRFREKPDKNDEILLTLQKYVALEDFLLKTIQVLVECRTGLEVLKEIDECIDEFNEYGSDFQDTWEESLWKRYECIKRNQSKKKKDSVISFRRRKNSRSLVEIVEVPIINEVSHMSNPEKNSTIESDILPQKYIKFVSQNPEVFNNTVCTCQIY